MILLDFMNKPINLFINYTYIKEAKGIIQSMPNLIVIGVTGSYGKTSVKNFLYKILSTKYNVLITPENYNTTLGVTSTIRKSLKATHDIFICEMGATKTGDIKEICDIVKPKHGIITSIGPQHLESFGSMKNLLKTKYELADSLPEDGIIFLNYDNEYIREYNTDKQHVSYGTDDKDIEDYSAYNIMANDKGLTFTMLDENEKEIDFSTQIIGKHNITNIIGCIAIANKLGIPMKEITQRVRLIEGVPHRLQLIQSNNNLIIDDAYNSNPNGAKSALETMALFDGVKILITPGMIELGDKQHECNYEFGRQASSVCDYIILVGKKQTVPIYEGIVSTEYNKDNIIMVEDIKEAFGIVNNINTNGIKKVILLENDLPDNY